MSDDFLVIGSGVGGATLAKELSKRGEKVTILES
jgi:choline dehydrogenase-like flavoprotein